VARFGIPHVAFECSIVDVGLRGRSGEVRHNQRYLVWPQGYNRAWAPKKAGSSISLSPARRAQAGFGEDARLSPAPVRDCGERSVSVRARQPFNSMVRLVFCPRRRFPLVLFTRFAASCEPVLLPLLRPICVVLSCGSSWSSASLF
jgi:hypothetical protein